jgi:hypothetical protein
MSDKENDSSNIIRNVKQLKAILSKRKNVTFYDGVSYSRNFNYDEGGISWQITSDWDGASGIWNCFVAYGNIELDYRNRIVIMDNSAVVIN